MKRIGLFLGVKPHAGGMFQYAQSLLDALDRLPEEDYQIDVAYIGADWARVLNGYRFKKREVRLGKLGLLMADVSMAARIPVILVRAYSIIFNPIAWSLRRRRCSFWIFPAQDAVTFQLPVAAVGTVHDLMHRYEPHFPEVVRGRRYLIREHRFRNIAKWAIGILVDSEMGKRHVMESYQTPAGKIFPLPYVPPKIASAIDAGHWSENTSRLPEKFFFYPAQFWKHKNHETLLKAAAAIKARHPDIHLVFTGSRNHEFGNIKKLVDELSLSQNVTFSDYVSSEDLVVFYRRARAMVMPTFFGPTNIPPLEAIMNRCPVAVSGIYGMPEQLGEAALYFDPKSVSSLSEVLERLWVDEALCQSLKDKGEQRLLLWNEDKFAERLRAIVDGLAARMDHSGATRVGS